MKPPAILVSPSVVTGYDFPYDECRFQIVGKLGFPDTRDPIMKARIKKDPDYSSYLAMQSLVQSSGRGGRATDDWCETFIIDDNAKWFLWKFKHFAPDWFMRAYTRLQFVPKARAPAKQ